MVTYVPRRDWGRANVSAETASRTIIRDWELREERHSHPLPRGPVLCDSCAQFACIKRLAALPEPQREGR